MAKITFNPNVAHVHGHVGNWVLKERMGVDIVAAKPDQVHQPNSPAQQQQRAKFQQAAVYAKGSMTDAQLKALYSAKAKLEKSSPFAEAVKDWFTPPVVDAILLSDYHKHPGEPISIRAHDDFEVVGVNVELKNASTNAVLESGPAGYDAPSGQWVYAATTDASSVAQVMVTATALDHPGHPGTLSATA